MKENKIIAEFMGYELIGNTYSKNNGSEWFINPQYHESWDWLMPVVDKCYKIDEKGFDSLVDAISTLDIDGTYKAVVEFINKLKKYGKIWFPTIEFERNGKVFREMVKVKSPNKHRLYDLAKSKIDEKYDDKIKYIGLGSYGEKVKSLDEEIRVKNKKGKFVAYDKGYINQ